MKIKSVLVFLSIHLLKQISILDAFRISCNASLQTVSRVTTCPSSNSSYEAAAAKKNCLSIAADNQQCESFEYHCVLSNDMTHAVEVCAPYLKIIGRVCAMFSSEFKSIMRIEGRNCIDCPYSYNSTNAFQYQECYANLSQLPLRNDEDSHMVIVIVILVLAAVFVIAVIVAVVKRHKIRKHFKCLKDHTDEIEMDNADHTDENEMDNADSLPDGEGATEQLLPENATNNDVSINEKTQALIEEHAKDGGSEYIEHLEENTDSPRLPKSIPKITPGQDIQHMAVLKTKISTTKKDNNILLQIMVNNLINTLKNPTESWTKDGLVAKVNDMVNRLYEREAFGLLDDFCKAINVDETIKKTLPICQKEIFEILDSLENKYHAKINVSDGCVCFTFYFDTNDDLQSFLVKVQEGEEELRKDISDLLLNKTLMEVFHVDSIYVNLVISKVTANKGSVLVYQKDFLKSATAEDMTAEGNIEDVILKKDLPESQKIKLESKFDSVLSSMKNPESMQETNLKTLVEEIVYEVIANKRIDLLTEFATTYEDEETQNALYQHGANMHRTLIPIFEDVNLILNISKKGHLMITVKDKEAYDEAVANRFRSSQVSLYIGYKFYITRALSFSGAAKWMKSRKQEFAKFGFFYKGTDLSTICFHCGCLKDGWAEEDDILATHLSLTESCEYANYMISALPLPF